jgi:glutamate-1-semialdehyde 2,1-aminomutase
MRAGLAALGKMEAIDGWQTLDARTRDWCDTLAAAFADRHLPLDVMREGSIFWIRRTSDQPVRAPQAIPAGNADWYARFFHAALDRGVYLAPSSYEVGFLSLAHDDQTLERAAEALIAAAQEAER